MTKRKKILLGVVVAALVVLVAGAVATRDKTRLRLAYPPGEVVTTRDVVYVAGSSHPKHRLDVYAPKDARGAPVVHFVHGGSWTKEDKDYYAAITGLYGSIGVALAKRGVVTVVQSYRLGPEVDIDGILDDVMAAMRWTQLHAAEHGGDPSRLFLMGHSAGGHIAALIGADDEVHTSRKMDPNAVRGYIPMSAVWDIGDMVENSGPALNTKVTEPVFGKDPARWKARSPMPKLHKGMKPFFVIVGERDYPFMIPEAERATARMKELGESPRYLLATGRNHRGVVLAFGASNDNLTEPVVDFVTRGQ